ncbi:hypothetical protein [uncultured Vibrio sp.]|uniref:hypothetical protein n=1 Tax=uncultured Vibrio sp. TaxID=114054 RepID=UPI0025F57551|nr:hypothetical protein [uncultured Vibrio sp.]
MKQIIEKALAELAAEFSPNELAYLGLTGKVELQIRDKLAYVLHRDYLNEGFDSVAREWKLVDLALMLNETPQVLLEAKAMYVGDFLTSSWQKFVHSMHKDLDKCQKLSPSTPFLTLLVASEVTSPVPSSPQIKYRSVCNKPFKERLTTEQLAKKYETCVGSLFASVDSTYGSWEAGEAYGIGVKVHYWLLAH